MCGFLGLPFLGLLLQEGTASSKYYKVLLVVSITDY